MVKSRLTTVLANITKKVRWPENNQVGFKEEFKNDKYFNPILTPPPRSPRTEQDFRNPERLGHWRSHGWDYFSPTADKYMYHEAMCVVVVGFATTLWLWSYGPDFKLRDWARREAYLRTHKREALGLPLIDKNVVDPDRIVLPSEEELDDFPINY